MVTKHSMNRAKERAGFKSLRRAEAFLENALERGKREDAFSFIERAYLQNLGKKDCTAIAYNGFCMIVSPDKVCVTMYELPAWFGHKKRYHGKERIRDTKKYRRFYGVS